MNVGGGRAAVALLALAACTDIADDGTPWQDAAEVVGTEVGPAPTLRAASGCTLRIASWNVHFLPDPQDLLAHLRASREIANADVILLQETSTWPGDERSRTAGLADQLAMTWAHTPVVELPNGVYQGNGILSRFPLERVAVKRLPYIARPAFDQARTALAADIVVGDQRVRVVSVHLDVRVQITDAIRQLDPAVTDLDERAVVGGDFNTAPWQWVDGVVPLTSTEAVVGMKQAAILDDYMASRRYQSAISPDTNTFTLPGFGMRLDNVYPRAIPLLDAGVEHVGGSDHWPIYADVDLCN
ncbi:MAG TPA: endonuclease/exonuclease/phosphatase family protein [Kofleriaceae bacterium]|nr:endonuclease/exonuclease/phosphatase family protein [Kofleriaceae bacterium]